jgi:hypothetical protein
MPDLEVLATKAKNGLQTAGRIWLISVVVLAIGGTFLQYNPDVLTGEAFATDELSREALELAAVEAIERNSEDSKLNVHQRNAKANEEAAREAWAKESRSNADDY